MTNTLNYQGILKEVRTRAGNVRLSVKYEDEFKPRTDGRTLYVQSPNPLWNAMQWTMWWYTLEHELGHNDPDMLDALELLREIKISPKSFLFAMLNLTDDNRQEYHRYYEYEGRRNRLDAGRRIFLDEKCEFEQYGQHADQHRLAGETWFVWDTIMRSRWMPSLIGKGEQAARDYLNSQQLQWLEALLDGDYEDSLKSGLNAREEYKLVKRIIDEVFKFDSEQEEKDAQEQQKQDSGEGQGDSGSDSNDPGEGEDAEGDRDGKSTKGSEDEGEDAGKRNQSAVVDYSDLLAHVHDGEENEGATYTPLKINYDSNGYVGEAPRTPLSDYILFDYTKGTPLNPNSYYARELAKLDGPSGIAKKVKRLLQTKAQVRYNHGKKRGRVSPKSIYRGAMKDSGEYQSKVFRKKGLNTMLDVAVSVLMDCSGSMGGEKYSHAGRSVVLLNEAISSLNIPVEITGFSDKERAPIHGIFKSFNKSVSSEDLNDRIADFAGRSMDGNSDGESITWAYNRLSRMKNKRKVLIVLSDGSPAGYRGDCDGHTKQVINDIEKGGVVEIYGLGIMDSNVKRLYKYSSVISDASELEAHLLTVLKDRLINS